MANVVIASVVQLAVLAMVFVVLYRTSRNGIRGRRFRRWFARVANRPWRAVMISGLITLGISIAISCLGWPVPSVHDEFSYLLSADTFAHGRLTNATHPMWEHFETIHVIQQPSCSSKYPPAQGLLLALGQRLTGEPLAGVWLGTTLAVMSVCWMLQAWVPNRWALAGTLLLATHQTVQRIWGQGYMGPAAAVIGAALLLGALPRLLRRPSLLSAVTFAVGLVILANSRPYEGLVVSLPTAVLLGLWTVSERSPGWLAVVTKIIVPAGAMLGLGAAAMCLFNSRVTGDPFTMPYQVHEQTYSVSPLFLWKPPHPTPAFRHAAIRDFQLGWSMEDYKRQQTLAGLLTTKAEMLFVAWYHLIGPMLTLPLVCCWPGVRRRDVVFVLATAAACLLGVLFVPWTQTHYLAPAIPALLVLIVYGLRRMRVWWPSQKPVGRALFQATVVTYLLAFSVGVGTRPFANRTAWQFQRAKLVTELGRVPGKHLVVVRYGQSHNPLAEWVYNEADIDAAKIIWAREMSPGKDLQLLEYFHDRRVWLLEPDASPMQFIEHRRNMNVRTP